MLVYDGRQDFKHSPKDLSEKVANSELPEGLTPPPSKRRLVYNRAFALVVLLAINTVTYLAIKALPLAN